MFVLCITWKNSRYPDFLPKHYIFPAKTTWSWNSGGNRSEHWTGKSLESTATGKYVSFRELLPSLSQLYANSQGLCEPWDCQRTHNIITFLGLSACGLFPPPPFMFFCTLFHYLLWAGKQGQSLRSDKMTELQLLCYPSALSVAIMCMEMDSWTHSFNWNSCFQCS